MKNYFLIIVILTSIIGCNLPETKYNSRIDVVDKVIIDGAFNCFIIEVDSHQYFIQQSGCAVHLESCPCKK